MTFDATPLNHHKTERLQALERGRRAKSGLRIGRERLVALLRFLLLLRSAGVLIHRMMDAQARQCVRCCLTD